MTDWFLCEDTDYIWDSVTGSLQLRCLGLCLPQFASKGIRKNEQVQGNLLASRLFWCKGLQDVDRAKEYLNRGLDLALGDDNGKNADGLIQVLNGIAYLGVFGVENLDSKAVADGIKKKMIDSDKEYYRTTVSYIKNKQAQGQLKALTY